MALSMDEQRALAEIERRLAADDPGLATCLTAFRRPGPATVLRSPRARIVGSLFTVLLVAMVSLMVYAMIPFRTHGARRHVERRNPGPRRDHRPRNGRPAAQRRARVGERECGGQRDLAGQFRSALSEPEHGQHRGEPSHESGGGPLRIAGGQPVRTVSPVRPVRSIEPVTGRG